MNNAPENMNVAKLEDLEAQLTAAYENMRMVTAETGTTEPDIISALKIQRLEAMVKQCNVNSHLR